MAGIPVAPAEYVKAGVNARVDEIFIARAGKVTAYDDVTNTAVVKPMVKHALFKSNGGRVYDELPEIPFVPVLFPRVGDFVLTMPVPVGTPVALLFLDVSHAEWIEDGEIAEPVDAQRHSLGWPVALLGLYPDSDRLSEVAADKTARGAGMVLGQHNGDARIEIVKAVGPTPHLIKIGKDATEFVALANLVLAELNAIRTYINAHTHTVPIVGAAGTTTSSAPVAGMAAPASVAAAKTKAK